jgi:protein SCO1/2
MMTGKTKYSLLALWPAALCLAAMGVASSALAQTAPMDHTQHHDHSAMAATALKRSEVKYVVPAVAQVRQDGKKASFPAELDDGRTVLLQFIYTSCTAICPVTTQTFAQVQDKLGKDAVKLHMVSVSIDPEYDTVARLDSFAKKLGAGAQWQFYTGTLQDSVTLQKAFDAYRGDKMNHVAVSYLRAAPGKPWLRLDGLHSAEELVKEYRKLVGKV